MAFLSFGPLSAVLWGGAVAAQAIGASEDPEKDIRFPDCSGVVDVTRPPYGARGDGVTDDTAALQKALKDCMGLHKIIYLPKGTYLVSGTLKWSKKNSKGQDAWGFNWIQGQGAGKTVLRLKDGTFSDASRPESIMWCGGFGSADWFHNYIQDITFDVGERNPGAVGLQFYSNNSGALRDVRIISRDGKGAIGLDLAHRDMNGPLLIRNLLVVGFEVGIRTGNAVNSQTFEGIRLSGQGRLGFENAGQCVSIRGLQSENEVTALRAESFTVLLDARLTGRGAAGKVPAILVGGSPFYARDVATEGYREAIGREDGKPGVAGPAVEEIMTGKPTSPFGGPARSLRLPVEEPPGIPWDPPEAWAVVEAVEGVDMAPAVQKAIDSGAPTVFLGHGMVFHSPVTVRGKVRRLMGTGGNVDYFSRSKPDFIIGDGEAPVVLMEHFDSINGGLQIDTDRTVVLRSVGAGRFAARGRGRLFLEDFGSNDLRFGAGQRVWARQLNVENQGTHVTADGALLWILGYKTERGGTLLHVRGGGKADLFGTFSYTTTAGKLAPMFVNEDSSIFAFFAEVCFSGDPFQILISETRKGITRTVKRGEGSIAPYVGSSR